MNESWLKLKDSIIDILSLTFYSRKGCCMKFWRLKRIIAGSLAVAVAFTPWVFSSLCDDHEFFIHAEDVLIVTDASEKMNTYYWESLDDFINNKSDNVEPEEPDQETLLNALKELARNRTYH